MSAQQFQAQGTVAGIQSREINGRNGAFTVYDIYLSDGQKYDGKIDHANKAGAAQQSGQPVTILWSQNGNYKKIIDVLQGGMAAPMGQPVQQFAAPAAPAQQFTPPPAGMVQQAPAGGGKFGPDEIARISRGNALNAACDLVGNLYATAADSLTDGEVLGKVIKFAEAFAPWIVSGQLAGADLSGHVIYPQQVAQQQDAAAEAPQVAPDPAAIAAYLASQGQPGVMVGAGAVAGTPTAAPVAAGPGALPPGF